VLVGEVDEHGWNAGFLKLGQVGQLPPDGAASPGYPLYQAIAGLLLLF
jgi:hypothetical protein